MKPSDPLPPIERRTAIKWMLTATASLTLVDRTASSVFGAEAAAESPLVKAKGYGPDPSMVTSYKPGDLWPLTFTPAQRRTASALCDVMIPADETSPNASAVGVTDFIDEWISSPYPAQA